MQSVCRGGHGSMLGAIAPAWKQSTSDIGRFREHTASDRIPSSSSPLTPSTIAHPRNRDYLLTCKTDKDLSSRLTLSPCLPILSQTVSTFDRFGSTRRPRETMKRTKQERKRRRKSRRNCNLVKLRTIRVVFLSLSLFFLKKNKSLK